jgi:hypothetical protein
MRKEIDKLGIIRYFNDEGELHREDGPAVEHSNGSKYWYKNGRLDREDGPAVENYNGSKSWHANGLFHREDGPAIIYANGDMFWYRNGIPHREDGPAVESSKEGRKEYWYEGEFLEDCHSVEFLKKWIKLRVFR